jgi:hypothetical protein
MYYQRTRITRLYGRFSCGCLRGAAKVVHHCVMYQNDAILNLYISAVIRDYVRQPYGHGYFGNLDGL